VFGRRRLPAKLRPKLERSERVLAWARTAGEPEQAGVVVVTTLGLWLPGRSRLGWHHIHKATWSGARLTVVPATQVGEPVALDGLARPARHVGSYTVMADDVPVTVALADPGDLPHTVRQRVTRSVAYTAHHPLPPTPESGAQPRGGVRVVARRVAGVDGLAWHVRYDEGTDTNDPSVMAFTADLVAEAAAPARGD
jgi:hypothetical protein